MSKEPPFDLEIPDGVESADQAVELIRAWITDGSLRVSLNADAFGERAEDWGRLLSEIGLHVAKALSLQGLMSEAEAEHALRRGFAESGTGSEEQAASRGPEGTIRGRLKH